MRTIQKNSPPRALVEWRARYKDDVNFGYDLLRQDKDVMAAVVASLLDEQGGLCAYTGRPISESKCHVEHLKPQAYCARGEDVDYNNLVACHPKPNAGRAPYGAHAKDCWPTPTEEHLFVSPTQAGCEGRFRFNRRGAISSPMRDRQAAATISRLALDHEELTSLRRAAIEGMRKPGKRYLSVPQLKKVVARLRNETGRLTPYSFAVCQGLEHYIRKGR